MVPADHDHEIESVLAMFNMRCIKNPLAESLKNGHELNREEYDKVHGYIGTLLDDLGECTSEATVQEAGARFQAKMPPCANSGCLKIGILQCSQCKAIKYCGRDCQKSHWKTSHKKMCKGIVE